MAGEGLTFWEVLDRVADAMGTRNPRGEELTRVMQIIEDAYQEFLSPALLPEDIQAGRQRPHKWSFLSPSTTLDIEDGEWEYDLPDEFGNLFGDQFFYGPNSAISFIRTTSQSEIRQRRMISPISGDPYLAAIVPMEFDAASGQKWQVQFYPTPNAARTLYFSYEAQVGPLAVDIASGTATLAESVEDSGVYDLIVDDEADFTDEAAPVTKGDKIIVAAARFGGIAIVAEVVDANTLKVETPYSEVGDISYRLLPAAIYFLGGTRHSQTILAQALALMEQRRDKEFGVYSAGALNRLRASIAADRQTGAVNLGQMGGLTMPNMERPFFLGTVTHE